MILSKNPFFLKLSSALIVSLAALTTSNQVSAACVGSPILDCTGATTGPIAIDGSVTTLDVQAGATVTAGPSRVDTMTVVPDLTANIDGTIDNTATGTYAGGLVTRNNAVDLIVNNNATGIVRIAGSTRSVAVGSDGINSNLINSLQVTNAGLIEVTNSNAYSVAGGENADTITIRELLQEGFHILSFDE